jgi:hypothetical protein
MILDKSGILSSASLIWLILHMLRRLTLLHQPSHKTTLSSKMVKRDPKVIITFVNLNLWHTPYVLIGRYKVVFVCEVS